MWIYKITNIQNNKIYIGQSKRLPEKRLQRHFNDALNNNLDTHFARAIRKYGKDSFKMEIIDSAMSQEELTEKEHYWIRYFNSDKTGYNETDAEYKCGGNTYKNKSESEMKNIKEKIRQTKLGKNNPMARKIKMTNIETNEIQYFDTIISCARFLGIKGGKTSITERLNGQKTSPFRKKYIFEYCDK